MVQAKIKEKNDQWMAEIRMKDKGTTKKFWNHVKELRSKKDIHQMFLLNDDGKHLEEGQALAHIHRVISEKFGETEVKPIPIETTQQKTMEREIRLGNFN